VALHINPLINSRTAITLHRAMGIHLFMHYIISSSSSCTGFVVDKAALGQVFIEFFWFSPVSIIPQWQSILIFHLRDEQ
jgi:hypothetical protein